MASPASDAGRHLHLQPHHPHHHSEPAPEPAVREAQRWIEAVTGRTFGDKDFRGALDNGILLCELLSSIKPGLVKKINRLPTSVAGLDNVVLFLKGCEEFGLKGSQLFDPGDLQDTSTRNKGQDSNRKLKNVLITIYWLGRTANSSATYNGPTLDLQEFEGLISQMRREAEECDSPKRSIRDSGYIDCWESERSDSLSPPRHTRDDSFDSLDSIGSRSRQTPSPDGLLARVYSDGRGSDSESDAPQRKIPDVRKDDMLVRRTSYSEPRAAVPFNQYLPNKSNQSSYMPAVVRRPRANREDSRKSWSNATSPVSGERPFSGSDSLSPELSSAETGSDVLYVDCHPIDPDSIEQYSKVSPQNDLPSTDTDTINPQLSDPQIRSQSPKDHLHPSVQPQPQEQNYSDNMKMEEEEIDGPVTPDQTPPNAMDPLQCDLQMAHNQTPANGDRFSRTDSVFDDPESVSMIDMRSEEDSMLPPHSQVRHELMHNQYNKLKEEEDHWQDDLARWKNRRRSASQDLIKKEEERKMMERMMSVDGSSQRRKSIKTYREIVQEKERREHELHEAYRNARTPEEAAAILHRYAQRFTISEAVLERLKLPKLLERSVSADPTHQCSFPTSPDISSLNPLQYLRQQSLPVPKFTSTVEARVTGFGVEQGLKPYRQSRPANNGIKTAKVDETARVNGEREDDVHSIEEEGGRQRDREMEEDCSLQFYPSPSQHTDSDVTETDQHTDTHSSIHETERSETEREMTETEAGTVRQAGDVPEPLKAEEAKAEDKETVTDPRQSPEDQTCLRTESNDVIQSDSVQEANQKPTQNDTSTTQVNKPAIVSPKKSANQSEPSNRASFTKPVCEPASTKLANSAQLRSLSSYPKLRRDFFTKSEVTEKAHGNVPPAVLHLMRRGEHFSWNPEEERKRQERWQQEQERMLQEKYRREQEKLRQEWEQAQKEVEEEEKRYHEEERKILEETVTPLTPHLPIAPPALPNSHSTLPSHHEWESKQGPVEKQTNSENCRQRENGINVKAQQPECLQMISSSLQSCGQTAGQPHGQRGVGDQSQDKQQTLQPNQDVQPGSRQDQQQTESSKKSTSQSKAGGRRRSGSIENIGPNSSTSSSFTDTQPPSSPNRSVSGKKLCSSCGHPLGKGAAMIIETLSLYFHIQCFKCGICKGQLGDTSTGTDVRIRNGLLNCHQCYVRSRSAGQPTTL